MSKVDCDSTSFQPPVPKTGKLKLEVEKTHGRRMNSILGEAEMLNRERWKLNRETRKSVAGI